jgi:hypothetical protein
VSFTINKKSQPKLTTSIFSCLNEDKPQTLSSEPVEKEVIDRHVICSIGHIIDKGKINILKFYDVLHIYV